jgi:hypothetical protein
VSDIPVVTNQEVNEVAKAVVETAAPKKRKFYASIHPGPDREIDSVFASSVLNLEKCLGCPVWVIIQNDKTSWGNITPALYNGFFEARKEIEENKPVAILIDSPGGSAAHAFKIARLFQRRASDVKAVIPKYAKSAATLLALGASSLILGEDAELGPLDVQMFDFEREEFGSALNAVQSLERINAFSLATIDQMTPLLMTRTNRKLDTLLPIIMNYTVNFVRPLLEKIDTVDFTKKSRELKVAEEYAYRLMRPNYGHEAALRVAQHLVDHYPTHGFAIDAEEAKTLVPQDTTFYGLGLRIPDVPKETNACLDTLMPFMDRLTIAGRIKERTDEKP